MSQSSVAQRLSRLFFHDPAQDLKGKLASEKNRLERAGENAASKTAEWYRDADWYLKETQRCLEEGDVHEGWGALQAAQRAMLGSSDSTGLYNAALQLRQEMEKLSGWRLKAMQDLICDAQGKLLPDIGDPKQSRRLIDAIALRDDYFQNNYFKIVLRRKHLLQLTAVLWIGIALVVLFSAMKILPAPFRDTRLVLGVVLLGGLSAALSVARGLLAADATARIPTQRIGAFLIWMRPGIGATAALISLVLVNAKAIRLFEWEPNDPTIILTVAVVAGFSERFIVGAIGRLSGSKDSADDNKRNDKSENKTE